MPISISQVVSVALALAVVYYVLGLLVSAITKWILETLQTRGKTMEAFLKNNLIGVTETGKHLTIEKLKEMPQVNTLKPVRFAKWGLGIFTGETEIVNLIEKVPAKNLVDAIFDIAGTMSAAETQVDKVISLLPDKLPGQQTDFVIKTQLQQLSNNGFKDAKDVRQKMETWVGGLLDQAALKFRAEAQRWVLLISFVVTIGLGVDSIDLAQRYWYDAGIAATADAQASLILSSTDDENVKNANREALLKQLDEMKAIDYQWYARPADAQPNWLLLKIVGLLLTVLAVSRGSSFWYDMIKQIKGEQKSPSNAASTDTATIISEPTLSVMAPPSARPHGPENGDR